MKLIKPSVEIIPQAPGLEGVYKQIELAGRTCYKSEDGITETSAKEFVDRMIKSGHGAMLEHGTVYLSMSITQQNSYRIDSYIKNKYTKTKLDINNRIYYVTTNLRVLVENNWLDDLQYLCEPTEHHEKRYTVKFICDRGILAEFTRHRSMSFAAESTRYCNYSRNKFNNELTFIQPCWYSPIQFDNVRPVEEDDYNMAIYYFQRGLAEAEEHYLELIQRGWKPQQARAILPNALKTELVMTGFVSDWKHFFSLRTPNNAHPQARELAIPLKEYFIIRKYI